MFLKSLEIRGFKSFANTTEINFNKGITAIVGPNGSGKSNISDAVRWVLGEQSIKNLRGDKMEDVIFAGTQFRKPVSLAQVALTLDNNDNKLPVKYSYITITRRIYRSGESEYYINNTRCRLKDIQELFMDTGIGKEGYSIISQGKIDAILNGKPEDKRKLLEEAAGIVKFKTRKELAEKKLQNTEQNFIRINDILKTYEDRLEPLEQEKAKAQKFIKLSDELKIKEINVIIEMANQSQKKIENLKNNFDLLNRENQNLVIIKQNIRKKEDYLNEKIEKFDLDLNIEKENFYDKKSEYKDILSQINILNERVNNLEAYIKKTSVEINEYAEELDNLKNEKSNKMICINKYKLNQSQINDDISKLEQKYSLSKSQLDNNENLIKELQNKKNDLNTEINNKKNQIKIHEHEKESLQKKLEAIVSEFEQSNNSININKNTYKYLLTQKEKFSKKIDEYNNIIRDCKKDIITQNKELKVNNNKLSDYVSKYNTLTARNQILVNFDNKYEGYNKSVKTLMSNINENKVDIDKNKCNVLGNVIKVEKKFENAIEIALGNAISNIITSDENVAKHLINYLKKNKLGRATFLPLNIIRSNSLSLDSKIVSAKGFLGIASKIIEYDKKFDNVVSYVLGRTLICENIDFALDLAKKIKYKYKIVTLDGDVINSGGALTGGSIYHKSTNIFSRKREIKETYDEIQQISKNIENIKKVINDYESNIKNLNEKSLNLKDEIYIQNIEITKIDSRLISIKQEIEKYNTTIDNAKHEVDITQSVLDNNNLKIDEIRKQIDCLINSNEENEDKIGDIELKLKDSIIYFDNLKENITDLKIKKAQIDEIVINEMSVLERINKNIENTVNKHKFLKLELEKSNLSYNSNLKSIADNKNKIKDTLIYIDKMEKKFELKETERIKIKNDVKKNKEEMDQINIAIQQKEKQINKFKILLAKNETEIENIYNKLNDEYNLTFAEALEYKSKIIDFNHLKTVINELKNRISDLGVVNLGAIKEYDDIKQKYDFMNSQREDLLKSKQELNNVINELTYNMKNVFKNNFKIMKKLFNLTFQELFKGGSADLILGEGDELSSSIEINVQPPGKKLQNINLMSGGEKVLSAIALLFAILKMKPTPFCILDEIEAALDDANVKRYADFLKGFSIGVQFIVITHRKTTMEVSDSMYGVTMQEKGVSKVVSVDLDV